MLTRDSVLFSWIGVAVAIAGYFAAGGDPRAYDFSHWMQAVVAVGGIITAKLGTSPLPSKAEANSVSPR